MFAAKGVISSSYLPASGFDPNAQSFFTATGITDPTIQNAINTLVLSAKSHGWWTKCFAIYPMVGGTSTTCSYNLKNTALYQLTFNGGWTFAATGATPNGSTGYADTGINISSVFTIDDTHLSYYSRHDSGTTNQKYYGAVDTGSGNIGMQFHPSVNAGTNVALSDMYDLNGANARVTGANTTTNAYFMASRTSSASHVIYKNGSSIASNSTDSGSLANLNLFIANVNQNGSPQAGVYATDECAFFTAGLGMSGALALTTYNDITTFETTLGRQN